MAEPAVTTREPVDVVKPKKGDTEGFLAQARKRFDRAASAESENRRLAVEDLRFKKGDQWPADIRADRTIQKRPCLTINKMKTFVHQITNDQRQNRPSIMVSPIGDKSDPNTAQMLRGLIRQIERQSCADVAYDTAFDGAVSNGWGYWRIRTKYEGEDSFDQVIVIDRIRNPFRVYMDPDCQQPDASDAKWCFISDLIPREEFEREYPDANPVAFELAGMGDEFHYWTTQTHVRVAEYFYFQTEMRELVALANGHVGYKDELAPEVLAQIDADASFVTRTREVECERICWDTITAFDVLCENDWAGKWIPVVRVIGDEVDVEGKTIFAGLIRDAKDAQRMYNFWVTSETELIALAPKAPWIMEEGQVEGHEKRWQDANQKAFPYLLYKGTSIAGKPAPAPQRQQFAGPPAGVVQAKMGAAQDMQATTGIRFDATLNERMYDESGKALRELKRVGDLGNFHYVDNLARSLKHTGRILIDLIPKIYDTPRVLTILREDDSEEQVKIEPALAVSHQTKPGQMGKVEKLYNPKVGTYAVAVTIGPSFATKRAEAADSMVQFMKAVPQAAPLIGDLIAKNMDWPGAEEIATRLAAAVPPNVLGKDMDNFPPEAKAMVNSMQMQLQQLSQQHEMAMKALNDQNADRALEKEKIDKDFEAKLTKIAADMETKMMGIMQTPLDQIAESVQRVEQKFEAEDAMERQQPSQMRGSDFEAMKQAFSQLAEHQAGLAGTVKEMIDSQRNQPPRKRSTKVTGPGGKVYTMETEE